MKNPQEHGIPLWLSFTLLILHPWLAWGDPLDHWSVRNPRLAVEGARRVAFGNGVYVAVGDFGCSYLSTDGATWVATDSGTFNSLFGLTYQNGLFVATGEFGEILTSTNGVNWTQHAVPTFNTLRGAAFGAGKYVAVGDNSEVLLSADAQTWVEVGSGSIDLLAVCYGKGLFVAAGADGVVLTSSDGTTWTRRNSEVADDLCDMVFNGERFVAVAGRAHDDDWSSLRCATTSETGLLWLASAQPNRTPLTAVTYANSKFVAVGSSWFGSSTNGLDWVWDFPATGFELCGVAFGSAGFVAVSPHGTVVTSADGSSWTNQTSVHESSFSHIIYSGSMFVAVGDGVILTSPDGAVWTPRTYPTNDDGHNINGVAYGNGTFVAVGGNGYIISSTNAIDWERRSSPVTFGLYSVAFCNGTFVCVGSGGNNPVETAILTSSDGISWTRALVDNLGYLFHVTYGNGVIVASGGNRIVTSSDAVNWNSQYIANFDACCLAYGNGVFIANRDRPESGFWVSADGYNWTLQPWQGGAINGYWYDLQFSAGFWIAVGYAHDSQNPSLILTSPDGVSWSRRTVDARDSLISVTYGTGTFVAVGYSGLILQSDPLTCSTPQILQHPISRSVFEGEFVTMQVTAIGTSPLSYQWWKDGRPIAGATNAVMVLYNLNVANSGEYYVTVTNPSGSAQSQSAILIVQAVVPLGLAIQNYAGLSITGLVGRTYALQYTTRLASSNDWQTATNLLLNASPQVWIDFDSVRMPRRFYRATLLP